MNLWRLDKAKYVATTLQGLGAAKAPGRWNFAGQEVVYCAEHPALAVLEVLVHLEIEPEDLPPYQLVRIELPDAASISVVEPIPPDTEASREIGGQWIREGQSLLLRVPSIVVPTARNVLINPNHPDAGLVAVVEATDFRFDERLFRP